MKTLPTIIVILSVSLPFCSNAAAQEPTLEETATSIQGKLINSENGFHLDRWTDRSRTYDNGSGTKEVIVNKCDVTYVSKNRTRGDAWDKGSKRFWEAKSETYKLTFSMADIDPLSVSLTYNYVTPNSLYWVGFSFPDSNKVALLKTTKIPQVVQPSPWTIPEKVIETKPTQEDSQKLPSFSFGFHDEESATRFMKALKHGVKLCGGKVDPF